MKRSTLIQRLQLGTSLLLLTLLTSSGCVSMAINCPASGPPITATINGPDITQIAQSVIGILAATGVIAGAAVLPKPQPQSVGSVSYYGPAIFGNTSISCGPTPPLK